MLRKSILKFATFIILVTALNTFGQTAKPKPIVRKIPKTEETPAIDSMAAMLPPSFRGNFLSTTTEEEYNYMTKGYASSIDAGLDIKKGYKINPDETEVINAGGYSFTFIQFKKLNDELVGIIVKILTKSTGITKYIAIPVVNETLLTKFAATIKSFEENLNEAILTALVFYSFDTNVYIGEPTTEEEYNYMVKGYSATLAQGLDIKKGYSINPSTKKSTRIVGAMANYDYDFISLDRTTNGNAGLIVKMVSDGSWSGGTYYFGVANCRGEILNKFTAAKNTQGSQVSDAILLAFIKYYFGYLN
jgi:hypothetical protein